MNEQEHSKKFETMIAIFICIILGVGIMLISQCSKKENKKEALYQAVEERYSTVEHSIVELEECGKYKDEKIYRIVICFQDLAEYDCIHVLYVSEDLEFVWRIN